MMGQINPAGFQSPMYMFYVYVIVEIKYFWLDLTWLEHIEASYNEHDCSILNMYDCNGITFKLASGISLS